MTSRIPAELLLLGAISCVTSRTAAPKKASQMIEIKRQINQQEPVPVAIPAVSIFDVDQREPLPVASPAAAAGCSRPDCNESLSSRLPAAAPAVASKDTVYCLASVR
jgi:hypothetical protein